MVIPLEMFSLLFLIVNFNPNMYLTRAFLALLNLGGGGGEGIGPPSVFPLYFILS